MEHEAARFRDAGARKQDTAEKLTDSPDELHEKLVEGNPASDYDRSLTRESEFGGDFGQGHYTGTSWDPELRETPAAAAHEPQHEPATDEDTVAPRHHAEKQSGSAGAGKLGGVPNVGLTTGGSSRHSS